MPTSEFDIDDARNEQYWADNSTWTFRHEVTLITFIAIYTLTLYYWCGEIKSRTKWLVTPRSKYAAW